MGKFEKFLSILLILLGIMSVGYYVGLTSIGSSITFSVFWILLSFILFTAAIVCIFHRKIKYKLPKSFKVISISLLAIFIAFFISVEGIILHYGSKKDAYKPDYIIVLGAGLTNGKVSTTLKLRLDSALELYNKLEKVPIIVSGGQGADEPLSEAEAMKNYLMENNIPENKIITEDRSTDTYENLKYIKDKLINLYNLKAPTVTIVTNNFHMYRAQLIAKKHGFITYCYSAQSHPYLSLNFHVREFFAVIKAWVFGKY